MLLILNYASVSNEKSFSVTVNSKESDFFMPKEVLKTLR